MYYPKKLEINVENDAQAALLYACFNHSTGEVLAHMRKSCDEKVRKMADYWGDKTKEVAPGDYVYACWKKVSDILCDNPTVPKFSVLLAALEKSGLTKEVADKKKNKDNRAKIVGEMNRDNNLNFLKIVKFKNIKNHGQLPKKYFENYPQFYLIADNVLKLSFLNNMNVVETHTFRTGDFCNRTEVEIFLGLMKKAGKRLTQINREEKQLPKLTVIKEFTI